MKYIALAAAAAVGFSGTAIAGPAVMTDTQMDNIVAGESFYLYEKNGNPNKAPRYKLYDEPNANDKGNNGNSRNWDQIIEVTTCESEAPTCAFDGLVFEWNSDDYDWDYVSGAYAP